MRNLYYFWSHVSCLCFSHRNASYFESWEALDIQKTFLRFQIEIFVFAAVNLNFTGGGGEVR